MSHSGPESTLENFLTTTESKRGHDVEAGGGGGCIDGR